jgi:hypothetical protein
VLFIEKITVKLKPQGSIYIHEKDQTAFIPSLDVISTIV